jgi:hypothetical protein
VNLGLPDPNLDPLVGGTDPSSSKNSNKNLDSNGFATFFYDFLSLKNEENVASKSNKKKTEKNCL